MTADPRIMAIDPGESTGIAWTDFSLLDQEPVYRTTVAPNHESVYQAILGVKPRILIVEWFITGQRLNQFSRRTIELCGGCEAAAHFVGAKLVKHTPQTRYPRMDEAERILIAHHGPRGTTVKGRGTWTDHQQDALAHLLVYEIADLVAARLTGAKLSPLPRRSPSRSPVRPRRH